MAPTAADEPTPPASPLIQLGGPAQIRARSNMVSATTGRSATGSTPDSPPMAPRSPPSSPRLSPARHTRQKSFTLTPNWQKATATPPSVVAVPVLPLGQSASTRSLKSEPSDRILEPAIEEPEVGGGGSGDFGGVNGLPPGMMQVAFFPEAQDAASKLLDEEGQTYEAVTTEDDEASDASVTGSVYSYNTVNSIWGDVPEAPPDAILGIAQSYKACTNPNKVNVCVGAYRTSI